MINVVIGIAIAIPLILLHGLILQTLWGWFVVSIFGLNPINLVQSLGVSILFIYLFKPFPKIDEVKNLDITTITYPFSYILVSLAMGYVVKSFL